MIHVDQRNAFINPLQPDRIYLCNDGGVYTVDVNTNQFTNLSNGLIITQFFDIAVAQSTPDVMSGGSQDNGNVFLDGGQWTRAAPTADGMMQAINQQDADIRYNAIQVGTIFRFIDGSRVNISNNIPEGSGGNGEWVTPFMLDPNDPETIYAAYKKVFKSEDQGNTWEAISGSLANNRNLDLLAVAPSNSEKIYAVENFGVVTGDLFGFGHSQSILYVKSTTDNSWTSITLPVTEAVEDIMVHPEDENQVYITLGGYTNGHKVFKSVDGGDNWENISGALPNVPTTAIARYAGPPEVFFVGTDAGVYYLEETIEDWALAGNFPHTYITDIEIQESESLIRVGTHGRGIFEGELNPDVVNIDELEGASQDCYTIFPNPTKAVVDIKGLPANTTTRLYDGTGKYLSNLNGSIVDLSIYPDGVYYLMFSDREEEYQTCVQKILKTR